MSDMTTWIYGGGGGQWASVDIKKALQDALVSFADEYKKRENSLYPSKNKKLKFSKNKSCFSS